MREFVRSAFSFHKLQQLCVNTALGNFVGYVAGSLVTLLTTHHTVERKALRNLFGILPRHTVVVHRLPQWLEWVLSILFGYLVMELVRYIFAHACKPWTTDCAGKSVTIQQRPRSSVDRATAS